jgi:hypothetical protein
MTAQIINTIGISLTMIGAILIAVDVTRQYKGKKFGVSAGVSRTDYLGSDGTPVVVGQNAYETKEYKQWQRTYYILMFSGLLGLLLGGVFQIIACWI